ncbi:MAG: hypothetical protein HOP12_01805 [Candidatus Eisenbacteria bacterium]|uniref:Glycosyl hydrolase family 32 N-terminal domain-containing protein n=1 Tax=Eiseniibacteriota bacterium TaxID=2212470 RepID=A0A849SK04_UNCEI|nr:hypothetical protein [Candidatus Eisenbacteria bacterium]
MAAPSLPSGWRLLWAAEDCSLHFVATLPAGAPCDSLVAEVAELTPPADVAENLLTAHFCAGASSPRSARLVLDLVGAGSGRLKVVALDPADSDSQAVLQSAEIRFNGGTSLPLPAVVLHVTHSHGSPQLRVRASGYGLDATSQVVAYPTDGSPPIFLAITSQSETNLEAEATLPSALPPSSLQIASSSGTFSSSPLAGDVVLNSAPLGAEWAYYVDPDPSVYPKDFAFIYNTVPTAQPNVWRSLYHLIYIRHFHTNPPPVNDADLSHAWSPDLSPGSWKTQSIAFSPSGGTGWDSRRVWAPSIVELNGTIYMYYTGLDGVDNQSIGYVTTSIIDTTNTVWSPQRTQVFTAGNTGWAATGAPQQFRDPFVMQDPAGSGRLFMWMVGNNSHDPSRRSVVGVARTNPGSPGPFFDRGYYRATDHLHSGGVQIAESPHIFPDADHATPSQWAQARWRLTYTDGPAAPDRSIIFSTRLLNTVALDDTTLGEGTAQSPYRWSFPPTRLYPYLHPDLQPDQTMWGWVATEYLRAGKVDFMAAYDGVGIPITRMFWSGPEFLLGYPSVAGIDDSHRATHERTRLTVASMIPTRQRVSLRVELPASMPATLSVFDALGRRVADLASGTMQAGMRLHPWDGSDANRNAVRSGVYFARLSTPFGARVVRIPLLR